MGQQADLRPWAVFLGWVALWSASSGSFCAELGLGAPGLCCWAPAPCLFRQALLLFWRLFAGGWGCRRKPRWRPSAVPWGSWVTASVPGGVRLLGTGWRGGSCGSIRSHGGRRVLLSGAGRTPARRVPGLWQGVSPQGTSCSALEQTPEQLQGNAVSARPCCTRGVWWQVALFG